jgi:hypothetical protein
MPTLPSGLKLYISKLSVLDFSGVDDWQTPCPEGHFWFTTPDLSRSPPPYAPNEEILFTILDSKIPTRGSELAQYIQVLFEDAEHGIYWRGDWLDTFHESYTLNTEDKLYWDNWLKQNEDFLGLIYASCIEQSRLNQNLANPRFDAPTRYVIMKANAIQKELRNLSVEMYLLSQHFHVKNRLPDYLFLEDYKMAFNHVNSSLTSKLYSHVYAESNIHKPFSMILKRANEVLCIKVLCSRNDDYIHFTGTDFKKMREAAPQECNAFGVARVYFLYNLSRNAEGQPGFYVKFEGVEINKLTSLNEINY